MKKQNSKAFTFIEILVVIGIISVVVVGILILMDPQTLMGRASDTRKKSELSRFKKALEEYYNDKGCYPLAVQICYPGSENTNPPNTSACFMCGTNVDSPQLLPYMDKLPCDPQHPSKKYQYVVDTSHGACPAWFKAFTDLNINNDADSIRVGCGNGGCGGTNRYGYDFGEGSPNITLPSTHNYVCHTNTNTCDVCGDSIEKCQQQSTCKEIFGTTALCCGLLPKPKGCP